jgi:anti-sigma regulatory factor (Ser/Thr protein kinase)
MDVAASWSDPDVVRDEIGAASTQAATYLSESRLAKPSAVTWARQRVVDFAAAAGIRGQRLEDVRLVVSEAVTNAVLYAYDESSPGEVHVIAAVVSGELWIVIADDGRGMHGESSNGGGLGLGLALMAQLSDGLTLATRASGGVEARMQFQITDPTVATS